MVLVSYAILNLLANSIGFSSSNRMKIRWSLHFSLVFSQYPSYRSEVTRYLWIFTFLQKHKPSLSLHRPCAGISVLINLGSLDIGSPTLDESSYPYGLLSLFIIIQSFGALESSSLLSYASSGNHPPGALAGFLNSTPYN